MVGEVIAAALLIAGVAVQLLAVLGVALVPHSLDRVHFLAASTLATLCLAAAVVVEASFSPIGVKALLLAAFVAFTGPVVSHVSARAIHASEESPE